MAHSVRGSLTLTILSCLLLVAASPTLWHVARQEPVPVIIPAGFAGGPGVAVIGICLKLIISTIIDGDHDNESAFTQSTAAQLRKNYPDKNVMVVHGNHDASGLVNSVHNHVELPVQVPNTKGYETYVFDYGDFNMMGDGGFINWCFMGNFDRTGAGRVSFHPIQSPPAVIPGDVIPQPLPGPGQPPPPAPPQAIVPPAPQRHNLDGIYLVNCQSGDQLSSGVAYYRSLRDGGNWGQQPDDYVDVTHGSYTNWKTPGSVVFPSTNTKFSWSVFGNGQELPDYAAAGMADNTYVHFWIYKDKPGATLYTVDGWDCKSVYWGF